MRPFEHRPLPAGQSPVLMAMINAIYGALLEDVITFPSHEGRGAPVQPAVSSR